MIVTPNPHANGSPYEKGAKKSRRPVVLGEQRGSVAATGSKEIKKKNPKHAEQYVTQEPAPEGPCKANEKPTGCATFVVTEKNCRESRVKSLERRCPRAHAKQQDPRR